MKNQGIATLAVLLIVIGVLVVGAGVWYLTQGPAPGVVEEAAVDEELIAETDPTAGWQTYRNEEFGFEFKYPNEFKIANISPVSINWSWESTKEVPWPLRLGVISNSDGKTIEQYILTEPSHKDFPYNTVEKNYSANGINGTIVSDPITMGENEYEFFWGRGSYIFRLSSTDLTRLKTILSTLRFIE